MTRINLVEPGELSNQHLVAEYREIFMVGSALQRSLKSKNWKKIKQNLPKEFTLNVGHVKFFYNKGKYLYKRYRLIPPTHPHTTHLTTDTTGGCNKILFYYLFILLYKYYYWYYNIIF